MSFAGRWLTLFCWARGLASVLALILLAVPHGGGSNLTLGVIGAAYGLSTVGLVRRWGWIGRAWPAWTLDAVVVLVLVAASGSWRSPFYLLALTAIVLPATALKAPGAGLFAGGFTLGFVIVSLLAGLDWPTLQTTTQLQTYVSHVAMPGLITFALWYSADLVRQLEAERERAEGLAVEAERRRIGWDLHDSAKQRIHAAHLILTALESKLDDEVAEGMRQARRELRGADADIETSLSSVPSSLSSGSGLRTAVSARADQLGAATGTRIEVSGANPVMSPLVAAHAYRIVSEAMINAMRHANAERIRVEFSATDSAARVIVSDDGDGVRGSPRPGSHGLRSMRNRAETIGALLTIRSGAQGRGTRVELELPRHAAATELT